MSSHERESQESFVPLNELFDNRSDLRNSFASLSKHTDRNGTVEATGRLSVLEEVESDSQFRNRPVSILCPGCGDVVECFEQGLPNYIAYFDSECSTCRVERLQRWSVVAIPTAHLSVFSTVQLAEATQGYWNRRMWAGIETSEGCYRTDEFTTAFNDRAKAYGWTWRVSCPLCRRTLEETGTQRLDYHHWSHSPDRGVCLCRDCHDAIGAGETDSSLDDRAREVGLTCRYDLQIARLAARESIVEDYSTIKPLAQTLIERYDLPYSPETVECIIRQTFANDDIQSVIDDHYLRKGLNKTTSEG